MNSFSKTHFKQGLMGLLLFALFIWQSSCYSFRGISIDPNVNTFYVAQLQDNALNAPPTLSQNISEALKIKIISESRLQYIDIDPDIEFRGSLVDYRVTSEAPQPGESTALNRLTITTAIEYIHNKDEEKGWKKNFSFFRDFPGSTNLADVEDDLTEEITNQILEDIFNAAFTDW